MRFTASLGVVALLLSLLVPAGAQMDLEDDPAREKVDYDSIAYELDLELKMLVFSLGREGEELVDCGEAVVSAEGEEPTTDVEGCQVVSIAGPNGQVNHGSIVSSMAHQFGPGKGKLMRHIAKSGLGKGDQKIKAKSHADDGEEEAEASDGDAAAGDADLAVLVAPSKSTKPDRWIPPGQAKKRTKQSGTDGR